MIKKKHKFIIPILLISLILTGCGENESERSEKKKSGGSESMLQISTFEGIKIPVYEKDLKDIKTYNPTHLSNESDPAFFRYINKDSSSGMASDFGYNNSDTYNTPFLFSDKTHSNSDITYSYINNNSINYDSGIYSNSGKQLEIYKTGEYLYEATSPTTLVEDNEAPGLAQITTIEDYAKLVDNIEFIHVDSIALTSDIIDISNEDMFIKYTESDITTTDGSELHGFIAGIEFDDKQYFYTYSVKDESPDYKPLLSLIVKNDIFDINRLFTETDEFTEKKTVTFDVSGTAASITVPSYFRTSEINDNIYSDALMYIPSDQRDVENPIVSYPNEYGISELYLTNEYYNLALTYNNFVVPGDCETDYEMLVRVFGISHGVGSDSFRNEYGSIAENPNIIERDLIPDGDGDSWKSYIIRSDYKSESNYPMVVPYYRTSLVYTYRMDNSMQVFAFSCGWNKWWDNEELVSSIDSIISSYTSQEASSSIPPDALSYYREGISEYDINTKGEVKITGNEEATPSDATMTTDSSGDIDEGVGHSDYIENGEMKGTSTGDENLDKDGFTQEYIDSLPFINTDEE